MLFNLFNLKHNNPEKINPDNKLTKINIISIYKLLLIKAGLIKIKNKNKAHNIIYKGIKIKFKSVPLLIFSFNLKVTKIKKDNKEIPIIFDKMKLNKVPA